ncbi:MAG: MOSC domain-containing protein [Porticoccaceae bacterium]|nr:MOSC domain-containing protein [Porticoccaceae bacterium]
MGQSAKKISASLSGIAIRAKSRAPMISLEQARVSVEKGVMTTAGMKGVPLQDFRGRPGKRQVTVLSAESWRHACGQLGSDLPWLARRANLLVAGIEFGAEDVGKLLAIGEVQLLITRETDPCGRMEEVCPGLKAALTPRWRGGVCCRVVRAGDISLGDQVAIISPLGDS